jgi:polyisoprenyl-teichoic acid--peptidoglycan teichoic acid transferase
MNNDNRMNRSKYVRNRGVENSNRLMWGLLAAFLLAALATAYLTFIFVRSVFASFASPGDDKPALVAAPPKATAVPIDPRDLVRPMQPDGRPAALPWDKNSRVTILFMGLDHRDEDDGSSASRTDTLILFTMDPETRSAGMLSLPRDLWVNIPGYNYGKINTAYFLGEAYGEPGGGPGLAIRTVEEFLGLPINFYAQVDFFAFERFIDELGGLEIDVPIAMSIDPVGPNNTIYLEPGLQMLDGAASLAYARARNTAGNDFDRADRQQQVIMAMRSRILSLNMLPRLLEKSPILYHQLSSGIHSNLNLEQVIAMAWIAIQIPEENIKRGVIGFDQVVQEYTFDGQDVLRPLPDEVRLLRDEILTFSGPIAPAPLPTEVAGNPVELRQAEGARVAVFNGTYTAGLGARTTDYLAGNDITVVQTDNAQDVYDLTTLINYSGKIHTQQYLVELLNVQPSQVFNSFDPNSSVDIAVFLGADWAENNSIP